MYTKHYRYPDNSAKEFVKQELNKRGVTKQKIAEMAYHSQKKFMPEIPLSLYLEQFDKVISKRNILNNLMIGLYMDNMASEHILPQPLQTIMDNDAGVFEVDELLALDIARDYGQVGVTNMGYLDREKIDFIKNLDRQTQQCTVFTDDLVSGLVAGLEAKVMNLYYETEVYKQKYNQPTDIDEANEQLNETM